MSVMVIHHLFDHEDPFRKGEAAIKTLPVQHVPFTNPKRDSVDMTRIQLKVFFFLFPTSHATPEALRGEPYRYSHRA